jgi:hypothetical protein
LHGLSADNPKNQSLILWPAMNNRIAPETHLITKRLSRHSKIFAGDCNFEHHSALMKGIGSKPKAWHSTISGRLPHIP